MDNEEIPELEDMSQVLQRHKKPIHCQELLDENLSTIEQKLTLKASDSGSSKNGAQKSSFGFKSGFLSGFSEKQNSKSPKSSSGFLSGPNEQQDSKSKSGFLSGKKEKTNEKLVFPQVQEAMNEHLKNNNGSENFHVRLVI